MTVRDHILVREPEYLNFFELITSPGFITMMIIIWSPVIAYLVIKYLFRYLKSKSNDKKKQNNRRYRDVA